MTKKRMADFNRTIKKVRQLYYLTFFCAIELKLEMIIMGNGIYKSQFPTVRGNGRTSRMFAIPVRYMTQRSKPRPKPA